MNDNNRDLFWLWLFHVNQVLLPLRFCSQSDANFLCNSFTVYLTVYYKTMSCEFCVVYQRGMATVHSFFHGQDGCHCYTHKILLLVLPSNLQSLSNRCKFENWCQLLGFFNLSFSHIIQSYKPLMNCFASYKSLVSSISSLIFLFYYIYLLSI